MLVSIIIPAFNAERFIDDALLSARRQSHRYTEIIVIDDASTDGTIKRIEAHRAEDPRITLIRLPRNQGQSAAANRGLAEAKGDYIKFFDADDLLSPETIAVQLNALLAGPKNRLAYGEWARFRTDPTQAVFTQTPGSCDGVPLEWILTTWANAEPMYQCALWLIPRQILARAGGWNERLGLINDFEFFTRLVLASEGIIYTPGARLFYRSGLLSSLSNQTSRSALESANLSIQLAITALRAKEDSPRVRQVCADTLMTFAQAYYPRGRDLLQAALLEVQRLGGSSIQPGGGRILKSLSNLLGWKAALLLRHLWRS